MRLGKLFGYGNGLSWHPERSELEQYGSNVTVRHFPLYKEFLDKAQELDNHSLIIVHSYKPVDAALRTTWPRVQSAVGQCTHNPGDPLVANGIHIL